MCMPPRVGSGLPTKNRCSRLRQPGTPCCLPPVFMRHLCLSGGAPGLWVFRCRMAWHGFCGPWLLVARHLAYTAHEAADRPRQRAACPPVPVLQLQVEAAAALGEGHFRLPAQGRRHTSRVARRRSGGWSTSFLPNHIYLRRRPGTGPAPMHAPLCRRTAGSPRESMTAPLPCARHSVSVRGAVVTTICLVFARPGWMCCSALWSECFATA